MRYMERRLDCDNVLDSDDPALDGKAVMGSDCYVKCKEKFHRKMLWNFKLSLDGQTLTLKALWNLKQPGAEFKDMDTETNDRFVDRNGQKAYRMTCDLHEGYVRLGFFDEFY